MAKISFNPNSSLFASQSKMERVVNKMLSRPSFGGPDSLDLAGRLTSAARTSHAGAINGEMHLARARSSQSAIGQMSNVVERLGTLSARASDGMLSEQDRVALNTEAQSLLGELGDIANSTHFNGDPILQGDLQTAHIDGPSSYSDADVSQALTDLSGLDLSTAASANAALQQVKDATSSLSEARSTAASNEAAISRSIVSAENKAANMDAAASSITDERFVKSIAEFRSASVQNQAELYVFKQGKDQMKSVLKLFEL